MTFDAPGLRGEVAAGIHERYGDLWRQQGGAGEPPASWVGRAALIEAGEAVRVAGWELPSEHPGHSGTRWYVLEPDGSLTELEWATLGRAPTQRRSRKRSRGGLG